MKNPREWSLLVLLIPRQPTYWYCHEELVSVFRPKGHKHWVLCIAWSPDGRKLASGCKNSQVSDILARENIANALYKQRF